jgi:hypothetical protein
MNDINIYNPGIQGYTIKGDVGEIGNSGYNLYYSVYTDESEIINIIRNNDILSDSYNINTKIEYNVNDSIISANSKMYTITSGNDGKTITYIGDIINQTGTDDSVIDFNPITIDRDSISINHNIELANPYKLDNTKVTKLYDRYSELFDEYIEAISVYFDFERIEGLRYRLVIMHMCGITQEMDITDKNSTWGIIEKKYFKLIPVDITIEDTVEAYKNYLANRAYIDVYNTSNDYMYRFKLIQD